MHMGTGSLSVPLAVPEGRNGLAPALSLGYSTGVGQTVFGLGWSAGAPAVARKTAKGIPRYDDRDVFVVSGAEDLVAIGSPTAGVTRYRPRTEGLFARI